MWWVWRDGAFHAWDKPSDWNTVKRQPRPNPPVKRERSAGRMERYDKFIIVSGWTATSSERNRSRRYREDFRHLHMSLAGTGVSSQPLQLACMISKGIFYAILKSWGRLIIFFVIFYAYLHVIRCDALLFDDECIIHAGSRCLVPTHASSLFEKSNCNDLAAK